MTIFNWKVFAFALVFSFGLLAAGVLESSWMFSWTVDLPISMDTEVPTSIKINSTTAPTLATETQDGPIYSNVKIFTPELAEGGDPAFLKIASKIVRLENVMWDGKKFLVYVENGNPNSSGDYLLTEKLISSWYYQVLSNSKAPVYAQNISGKFEPSLCKNIIKTAVLSQGIWCENHWHAFHDNTLPILSALGHLFDDKWDWNAEDVTLIGYSRWPCYNPWISKYIAKSRILLKSVAPGTCFEKIQINGDQRFNMYPPPRSASCKALQGALSRYSKSIDLVRLDQEKDYFKNRTETNKKIIRWVARSGSRRVQNRDEVIKKLREAFSSTFKTEVDIEVVRLEKMTLLDQLDVFRNADVVIGPHGAGLGKMFFLRPGSTLFQLMPFGMGKDQVPPVWVFNDGSVFAKGDNFRNAAICVGANYLQYDAKFEDSGLRKVPNLPKGALDPKTFWGPASSLSDYTRGIGGSKQAGIANTWYVAKFETYFSVNASEIISTLFSSEFAKSLEKR